MPTANLAALRQIDAFARREAKRAGSVRRVNAIEADAIVAAAQAEVTLMRRAATERPGPRAASPHPSPAR